MITQTKNDKINHFKEHINKTKKIKHKSFEFKTLLSIIVLLIITITSTLMLSGCNTEKNKVQAKINKRCNNIVLTIQPAFNEDEGVCISKKGYLYFAIINIGEEKPVMLQIRAVGKNGWYEETKEKILEKYVTYYMKIKYDKTKIGKPEKLVITPYIKFKGKLTKCWNTKFVYAQPIRECYYN